MPISQQAFKPKDVNISGSQSVKITNLNIGTSEVGHSLQNNIKQLLIRNRSMNITNFAFTSGESGTNYITLNAGCVFHVSNIDFVGKSLFVKSSDTSILEIIEFF